MGTPGALASQPGWSLIGSALEIAQRRSRAEYRNLETPKRRNVGTSGRRNGETEERRNRGTEKQRNGETEERRNGETEEGQTGSELSENPRKMSENIQK
jgi:hypothetical protein